MRNDAYINFLNSITLAGHFIIPEVLIVFGNKGFRGNRCRHMECDGFDCIDSPNFPPLVLFGIEIDINWSLVLRKEIKEDSGGIKVFCAIIFCPLALPRLCCRYHYNENYSIYVD